jgi:hypothetical protein
MSPRHVLVAFVLACGPSAQGVTIAPLGSSASLDFHVGDAVVYRFSGSFSNEPVVLREEVLALDGARVTIDVRATRGREERHWTQVGPADKDARWNNVADEIRVGAQKLPNPDNVTLARLYEWVLVPVEGETTGAESAPCERKLGSANAACTCERATHGAMKTEASRCAFAWQRGPARWTNASGDVVWQVEVVESTVKSP